MVNVRLNHLIAIFIVVSLCAIISEGFGLSHVQQQTLPSEPPQAMPNILSGAELTAQATEYKALREQKGHFSGGDHDKNVDGFGGRKHKVMESLGETLGQPGSSALAILENMGAPDEIVPKVGASNVGPLQSAGPGAVAGGMPGPVIGGGAAGQQGVEQGKPYFLVYHWRGHHVSSCLARRHRCIKSFIEGCGLIVIFITLQDYLWFEVDGTADEKITQYGWYAAGD
ncbi:hypothetical protein HKX48_001431 [Thoreauomyces humboldtii]|nr:hypothetical protein HKX48_001431 [Thoreauomyces humboldtii]